MTKLFLSLIDWIGEKLGDLGDWLADLLDDDCAMKRMQMFTVLLIIMACISSFHLSLPKNITGRSNYSGDIIYGLRGDTAHLAKGVEFDIYGYSEAIYGSTPLFWVQVEDGQRGFVPQVNVVSEFIALKGIDSLSIEQFDKVEIAPNPKSTQSYILTTEQGVRSEVTIKDMENFVSTLVDDKLSNYQRGEMTTYISKERFERRFMGREINYSYADYVRHYGSDSTVVRYGLKVVNKRGDEKGVFRPTVSYIDGVAQSYTLSKKDKINGNAKFLVYMPLSAIILDYGGWIINDKYDFSIEMRPTRLAKNEGSVGIFMIILAVVLIIFALASIGMTNHILPGIVFSLLPYKTPLNTLSNRAVYTLIKILMWVGAYIWLVLMLAYGALWWFVIPLIYFTSRRMLKRLYAQLVAKPSIRCQSCKEIDTKYRLRRDFVRSYVDTVYRSVLTRKYSVTGHRDSSDDYVRRTYTKYKETYDVDVYNDTYICAACKQTEQVPVENRKLTSRTEVGQHVETSRS